MRIHMIEPKVFVDCIKSINELVEEGKILVDKDKLRLTGMDLANVCMVDFEFSSSNCSEWDVAKELEIPLNLSNLKQVLRRASAKDVLTLEVEKRKNAEDKDENLLSIQLNNSRKFTVPTINIEDEAKKVPNLKFNATIKTDNNYIAQAIGDSDIVAESVAFVVKGGKFFIEAEGELNKANVEFGDKTNVQAKSEMVRGKYSIEYLKKIVSTKLGENVLIEFSKDYPLKMEFADKGVRLTYILAPRVENE